MAPVQKISSYSMASSASCSSKLSSKVTHNGDCRTASSEHWDNPLFVAPSRTTYSDAFFENARARFHQELTKFLAEWDDTEEMDDAWFGKEAVLRRRLSPQAQLSSHSKIRDNKFAAFVNENGDYEVMMNISELKLKDFKVRVTGERTVMVEGYKEEGNSIRSCHRSPRNFLYQFSLPDNATSDAISAVLSRDGILIITIPSKARNARNYEISLVENDMVNRANIIGESGEKCGRNSKVIEIQNCQSAADSSGSNLIVSSHRGSLESAPGRDPLLRCEKEECKKLKKEEDRSQLTEKNDIYTISSMASIKNNSSPTSSFTESKDSFSQSSLAKERRVKETIIPIRMEESGVRCLRSQAQSKVTIFHHSSLDKNYSCHDKDSLYNLESSNDNVALSQSEESVTNSTELQNEVLRCTNDNEERTGTPEHSTFAQKSEGLQMQSEGNIMSRDTKCNQMVTRNKCMTGSTHSRNTEFNEQEILSEAKDSEIIGAECGISEGVTDEKETTANFRTVDLVQKMSRDSEEVTRSFLCDNKRGKPMSSGISQELQIMNKSLFLEDSHFASVKASVISALKEILSRYGEIPETEDLVDFYRKCQEENIMKCDALSFSQEEDSSYKFVVDVCNLRRQSLTVYMKNEREICIEGRHKPKRGTLQRSEDFTKSFLLPRDAVIGSASATVSSDGFLLISVNKKGSIETNSDVTHDKGMLETTVANQHSDEEEEEGKVFRDVNKLSQEHQGQQQVLHRNEIEQELASDSSSASIASCASVATFHDISEEQILNVKEGEEQQEVLFISEVITPRVEEDAKFFDSKDRAYCISQEQQMIRLPSEKSDSEEFRNNSFLERKEQKQYLEIQALETSTNRVTQEVTQEQQDYLVASPSSTPFEETGKLQELEASVTAIEELNEISSNDNCRPLPVQEKGLFDEDAFYESVRHHFKVQKMETSSEHADSSFISVDVDGKIIIPLLDDQEDYEKTNYFENENEYAIILNVSKHLKETEMEVKVVSGNRVLIRCSSFLNEGELDHLRVFSKTFHLPDDIDATSGLCGISLDGILAVTFTKKVSLDAVQVTSLHEACYNESSQKDRESYILRGKSVLNVEESTNSEHFTGQELTLSLEDEEVNSSYGEEDNTEKTTTAEDQICDEAESFSRDTNAFWQATYCTASHSRTRTRESESVQDPFQLLNAGESESGEKALWMRETTAKDTMNGTLAGATVEEFAQEEVGFKSTSSDGQSQKVNMNGHRCEDCNVINQETEMMELERNINTSLERVTSPALSEHQELKSSLQTLGNYTDRFSRTRNGFILKAEEKGLFDEDAFFERARSYFVNGTERLSSVGDEQTNFENLLFTKHSEENKVATFSVDGQHCMAILDVSRCTNKTQLYIQVVEGKEILIQYPQSNEGESENVENFSMTFNLPCGIDVDSGVCGISSDGILFITFSKMNLESNETMSWNQNDAKTQSWCSLNGIPINKGNFLQKGFIAGAEKCEASTQESFGSSTTSSGVYNLKEQSKSNIKLLPITRKGNFFQDSFFQEVQHLFQKAIKKVIRNCTDQETCRHASDIKTYKCLCKQNPTLQKQAFHVEDDHIRCQILLDVENVTVESTTVYVNEQKDLVIEGHLKEEGEEEEESSPQLRTCRRCFSLPSNVDFREGMAALSSDGILYVVFQKTNNDQHEKEEYVSR